MIETSFDQVFRHGAPSLRPLSTRLTKRVCTSRGNAVSFQGGILDDTAESAWVFLSNLLTDNNAMHLQYRAAICADEGVLLPLTEGSVSNARSIDRFGDPDLMTEVGEEYLRQFLMLMPVGRAPNRMTEIMPPLLLLFTAVELSLKAHLVRSDNPNGGHDLAGLYNCLFPESRQEIEKRFADSELFSALRDRNLNTPNVTAILGQYSHSRGNWGSAYTEARYFAEPTRGGNLVKGILYPIFFPYVGRASIDAYWHLSGYERLTRSGADIQGDFTDRGEDNHGDWGLIPSSLGLVVISVSQQKGMDAQGEDLKIYRRFKSRHPTHLVADHMYGGNTLLFYRHQGGGFVDGRGTVDGLECRVWSNHRLGLHTRELTRLADALQGTTNGDDGVGRWQ